MIYKSSGTRHKTRRPPPYNADSPRMRLCWRQAARGGRSACDRGGEGKRGGETGGWARGGGRGRGRKRKTRTQTGEGGGVGWPKRDMEREGRKYAGEWERGLGKKGHGGRRKRRRTRAGDETRGGRRRTRTRTGEQVKGLTQNEEKGKQAREGKENKDK